MLLNTKMNKSVYWGLKKRYKMSYIIAGNYNNINFMMSDCIAESNGNYSFNEKIYNLNACKINTYVSLWGDGILMETLRFYDDWKHHQNEYVNYEDENVFRSIMEHISYFSEVNNAYHFDEQSRIYFLNEDGIFYYDIFFKGNSFSDVKKVYLNKNYFIICNEEVEIDEGMIKAIEEDLPNFCKAYIISYNKQLSIEYPNKHKSLDFKNRFSFINSIDSKIVRPFIDLKDYILIQIGDDNWNNIIKL